MESAKFWGTVTSLRLLLTAVAVFVAAAIPANAADLTFTAQLRGDNATTSTGSAATGEAKLVVHPTTQTVDMTLTVKGLSPADFYDHLAHAPVGPVHLHLYQANGDSSLLLPFAMGPAYAKTSDGFSLTMANYKYADGAKILASDISFDGFVKDLQSGAVVLNIHTQKFQDGEISGKVQAVH